MWIDHGHASAPPSIRLPYIPTTDGSFTPYQPLCSGPRTACASNDLGDLSITAPGLPQALPKPAAASAAPGAAPGAAAPAPTIDVYALVQQASTRVQLPTPTITIGPDPSVNEWKMVAVGQPVWFWTSETETLDASTTEQGIALTLVAHHDGTTIDTGDGHTTTCTTSTPRPADAAPMAKSPDCGHTWTEHGNRTVTATSDWTIQWAALGQSGTLPMTRTASRAVTVGQLASVVVR